jgi:hypothetical protein
MAYSEGLYYQKQGMYDDASRSFRSAGQHDPKFFRAAGMAGRMESTASYNRGRKSGAGAGTKDFEKKVTTSMRSEQTEAGMDRIQAANLVNGKFILNDELYWNFGSDAIAPPGGGPVWSGFGVIVIKGDLDAD